MSLINSDKFIIQRQSGEKVTYSASLNALYDYIAAHPTLNYRGLIDLTQPPSGQLNPDPPILGDIYLNSTDGSLASGYTGVDAGTAVLEDDRLIYNGTEFDIIFGSGGGTSGVVTVSGQDPIVVDNSDLANPVIELPVIDGGVYATT